jgi:FkbM family methyltransferase
MLSKPPYQGALNRVIFEYARTHPDATFVQVGANDGLQRDPLRPYIVACNWSGILIEPVPYVFARLKELYDGHPRVVLENVAIADENSSRTLYYLPQSTDPGLPQWYDALASFRKDVLLKHDSFIPDIADRVASLEVPCVTFDTLCERNALSTVDVIQIDTEGFDYEVVKLIDVEKYAPTILMYESLHLSPQDKADCAALLKRHGYELLSDGMDTLALRTGSLGWKDSRLVWVTRKLRLSASATAAKPSVKRVLRRAADRGLGPTGFELVRRDRDTGEQLDHRVFNPLLHNDATPLPPDAAEVLRSDSPRLAELRRTYAALDWPVCEHSRWQEDRVEQWVNLQYFRGDNIYVWQYRESSEIDDLRYFIFLRYLLERDKRDLVATLGEDGAFGCWTYDFPGYPRCSRDLLDSVNELLFLDRHLSVFGAKELKVLDIGAGYGRLAHRFTQALPGLTSYNCVDAIPESTFLSEYYTAYRGLCPPVQVLELPAVPSLEPGQFDLVMNVHSFSECRLAAIEWWMAQISRLRIRHFFLVPNEAEGFLSTEADGERLDYLPAVEAAGYRLATEERVFDDDAVRAVLGVNDRFCLFELS